MGGAIGHQSQADAIAHEPGLVDRPLRELVREVDPVPGAAGDVAEVVFEGEIDGVSYTVTRQVRARSTNVDLPALSSREREIGRMIAKGYTNKTIAAVLDISSWTVDTHVRRIFAKLGVRSRGAMVARLAAAGLVGGGDDATPEWQSAWTRSGG